ncbi:MAG: sodium-dependent transporter [Clostridia bacterium]|nr:sodium-dependent transporter [Clostridia bacterium]
MDKNSNGNAPREHLKSRLGFILISAGCAIGVGNVWKFPWMVGQYGGGMFVLIYLACLLLMGVPALTMEFAVGRAAQKSPAKIYDALGKGNTPWKIHSWMAVLGNLVLMMFYVPVASWMIKYFVDMALGKFQGLSPEAVGGAFDAMMVDWKSMLIYSAILTVVCFVINSTGVDKGVEKVSKVMMIALLVIMLVLAINSIFLPGAEEGLKFYLVPSLENFMATGPVNVIVAAMNQAFFTLSLGIGSMAIFGSYIGKDRALMGESVNVSLLDTFVAFTSGLIIFPACYAYGVALDSGPSLIFVTLPNIFNHIPGGRLWGALFFVFMSFAAISTVIAVFENIISCTMDIFNWSRKKSAIVDCIAILILMVPCILGFSVWSNISLPKIGGIMDMEDFLVSNILLPIGALIFILFCTLRYGWGWNNFVSEANAGKGMKVKNWMRWYMTIILPIMILVIFVMGLVSKFTV